MAWRQAGAGTGAGSVVWELVLGWGGVGWAGVGWGGVGSARLGSARLGSARLGSDSVRRRQVEFAEEIARDQEVSLLVPPGRVTDVTDELQAQGMSVTVLISDVQRSGVGRAGGVGREQLWWGSCEGGQGKAESRVVGWGGQKAAPVGVMGGWGGVGGRAGPRNVAQSGLGWGRVGTDEMRAIFFICQNRNER